MENKPIFASYFSISIQDTRLARGNGSAPVEELGSLKLYFVIAPILILLNLMISLVLNFKYKSKLFYWHSLFWLSFFMHIILQGLQSDRQSLPAIFLFSIGTFATSFSFSKFTESLLSLKLELKPSLYVFALGLFITFFLKVEEIGINLEILPALLGAVSPTISILKPLWRERKSLTFTQGGLSVAIILMALHTIDYAFAIDKDELMLPGYVMMLTLVVAMSAFSFGAAFEKVLLDYQLKEVLFHQSRMATLGTFAMEIAHEIRNPLTVIMGGAKYLETRTRVDSLQPEDIESKARLILEMTDRLNSIIRNLSGSSGNGQLDPASEVNLLQVVDDSLCILNLRAQKGEVEFRLQTKITNSEVLGRPIQLSQVFINLLKNAIDAVENLDKTEKWVEVSIEEQTEKFIIRITDCGDGIPMDIQGKLFQNLFTTKPPGRGTGLGLGISRKIIEEHGGRLYFNDSSKHTQFVIELNKISETTGRDVV